VRLRPASRASHLSISRVKRGSRRVIQQPVKAGITFQQLDAQACAMSDNDAAQRLNNARTTLFRTIFNRSKTAA